MYILNPSSRLEIKFHVPIGDIQKHSVKLTALNQQTEGKNAHRLMIAMTRVTILLEEWGMGGTAYLETVCKGLREFGFGLVG